MKTTLFLKIWFICIVREKGKKKKNKKEPTKQTNKQKKPNKNKNCTLLSEYTIDTWQ